VNARLLLQQRVVKLLTCNFYCQTNLDSDVLLLIKGLLCNLGSLPQELWLLQFEQKTDRVRGKNKCDRTIDRRLPVSYLQPCSYKKMAWINKNITTRVFNRYILNLNTDTTGMTYNLLYFLSCFRQRCWLQVKQMQLVFRKELRGKIKMSHQGHFNFSLGPAISDSDSILATSQQVFRKAWFISTLKII